MREANPPRARGIVAVLSMALALAGCAAPEPQVREGTVTVTKVDRASWNAPPEPGLYRVRFEPPLAQDIRRRSEALEASESVDYFYAEIRVLEEEATREMQARGLCSGRAKLASAVESGDKRSAIGGLFRCRPAMAIW